MDIKEFFGTDWRNQMSAAALNEADRLGELCPLDRAMEGCSEWIEDDIDEHERQTRFQEFRDLEKEIGNPPNIRNFSGELKWNLWAMAFKDKFLVEIIGDAESPFNNGKRLRGEKDAGYERSWINFSDGQTLDVNECYEILHLNCKNFIFPGPVSFRKVTFVDQANFQGAIFAEEAAFNNAIFRGSAIFYEVVFNHWSTFQKVDFIRDASFGGAVFTKETYFRDTIFRGSANFQKASFHENGPFPQALFIRDADFSYVTVDQTFDFTNCIFLEKADFSHSIIQGNLLINKIGFGSLIYYVPQVYHDEIIAELLETYSPSTRQFTVPNFIGLQVPVTPDLGYTDIEYHSDLIDAQASEKFRKLKEMAAQTSNHSKELEYFREELIHKPHSGESTKWTTFLITLYELTARCGTSGIRPAIWLFGLMPVFAGLYMALSSNWSFATLDFGTFWAFMKFSFHQAVPFLSLGGGEAEAVVKSLYGGYEGIPDGVGFWSGVQKAVSLTLEFLIGLGIRNYYRM